MSRPVAFGIGAEFPPVPNLGYREYVAILQLSAAAPTDTIINCTFPSIPVWSKTAVGLYYLTLAGAFPYAKTQIAQNIYFQFSTPPPAGFYVDCGRPNDNVIAISTWSITTGLQTDIGIADVPFFVRVYD